jgi:hypothetical protein
MRIRPRIIVASQKRRVRATRPGSCPQFINGKVLQIRVGLPPRPSSLAALAFLLAAALGTSQVPSAGCVPTRYAKAVAEAAHDLWIGTHLRVSVEIGLAEHTHQQAIRYEYSHYVEVLERKTCHRPLYSPLSACTMVAVQMLPVSSRR